jgi:hypothetical protein
MRRERKEHTLVMTLPFFGSSEDGALAWWSGSSEATSLVWVDRHGNRIGSLPLLAKSTFS